MKTPFKLFAMSCVTLLISAYSISQTAGSVSSTRSQKLQTPSTTKASPEIHQKRPNHPLPNPNYVSPPLLSPGVGRVFQSEIFAIEQLIQAKKYSQAIQELNEMPSQRITILWDDSRVPKSDRVAFRHARDVAISNWKLGMPVTVQVFTPNSPLSKTLKGEPEIKFEFRSELNKPIGAKEPLSLASFWGTRGKAPHYDVILGLKRGIPLSPTTPLEIGNDVGYALARYWGLAKSPIVGSYAYRVQGQTTFPNTGIEIDKQIESVNISAVADLRRDAEKEKILTAEQPGLFINPEKVVVDAKTIEGDKVAIGFQVTNFGNGPLQIRVIPDCSCFSADTAKTIASGNSAIYHVVMDTSQYFGHVHKLLYVMSNDPKRPALTIPVDVGVTPRYRLLTPNGTSFVSKNGSFVNHIYLTEDGGPLKVLQYSLSGSKGVVSMKKWHGMLPDPGQNQGPRERTGYEFTIHCGPHLLPARNMYTLNILTDDTQLAPLHSTFSVTYGIVATPEAIDMGLMPGTPVAVLFKVHRAGKPFLVKHLSCTVTHFKVSRYGGNGSEQIFKLSYDGLKPPGHFTGTIILSTNDPLQPYIRIPLEGDIQ